LKISIDEIAMDGENFSSVINNNHKRIDLADYLDWDLLEVSGSIILREKTVERVLPEEINSDLPIRLTLALRAPNTHLRKAVWEKTGKVDVGKHKFEFKLKRENYFGKVGFKPYLIRTSKQETSVKHASHSGARLASARKWTIIFDKEEGVSEGHMEIRYEDFSELPSTDQCGKCLYHLSLEVPSKPILFINNEHEKIREVLDNKGTRGPYARLREVLFDHISTEVMTKLLLKALEDIDEDGEVRYDWEDEVLNPFIEEQYPDRENYQVRLSIRNEYWDEERSIVNLITNIQLFNQKNYTLKTHIEKLIGEVK